MQPLATLLPPPWWSPSSLPPPPPPPLDVSDHHRDDVLHADGDHGAAAVWAGGCSAAADHILRDEEIIPAEYLLPIAASSAAVDDHYIYQQLQGDHLLSSSSSSSSFPAAAAAGEDVELPLLPFTDIDLDAFDDDELTASPPSLDAATVPAGRHHSSGAQNACHGMELDVNQQQQDALADDDNSLSMVVVAGYEMGVRYAEQKQRPRPSVPALPPLPPPPPPRQRRMCRDVSAPAAGGGRTRLDHIGFEELRRYFYMPITMAARELNVGLTVLKKRCRELGVARWPHRKMKSLNALILNVQEMGSKGMSAAAMRRELAALEECRAMMEENPAVELTERTKKLRQACFKESYKRRRAAGAVDMLDHCFVLGLDHQQQQQPPLALPLPPPTDAGHRGTDFFGY